MDIQEVYANQMMKFQTSLAKQAVKMLESIPAFAQDPDEDGWRILTGIEQEIYTGKDLDTMRNQARKLQYTPYGICILQTLQNFIIGKSASINSLDDMPDDGPTCQKYWDEWAKRNKWDARTKESIWRLFRDGEVMWRWFYKGEPVLRFVEVSQIKPGSNAKPTHGIKTDPDDIETVVSYHREWEDENGASHVEDIDANEIDHMKILVDSNVKRGISYFVPLAKYVSEYEKWLQDRITLNKIRHLFNVVAEPLNPSASISTIADQFEDQERTTDPNATKNKKIWKPGSVLATKGVKWDLKALNIDASDTKDDGRAIQLMIGIATTFPEYIIRGDASNANYSSSMVSESPFVRNIQAWQDHIAPLFQKAYKRVIEFGLGQGDIPKKYTLVTAKFDNATGKDIETKQEVETTGESEVNYDSVIARQLKDESEALQIHVNEEWCSKRTASGRFGYDYNDEQDQIARERREDMQQSKMNSMDPSHLAAQNQDNNQDNNGDNNG